MRSILLASSAIALALTATAARADDDVQYASQKVIFATATDPAPIITPDVTYEGPHAVVLKSEPGPGRAFVSSHDDVRYDSGPASLKRAPAREPERCLVAGLTGCRHHG